MQTDEITGTFNPLRIVFEIRGNVVFDMGCIPIQTGILKRLRINGYTAVFVWFCRRR